MDGQPRGEAHRRGGGRGGGLGRKNSGGKTAYRRVQASTSETAAADVTKTDPSGNNKSQRSVQVVDTWTNEKDPSPAPFKSSLKASLQQDPPPAPAKRTERLVRVEKDRKERPKSPPSQKRDLQVQTNAPKGGKVISLSSPSPQKAPGQTKRFVSSLAQAIGNDDRAPRRQEKDVNARNRERKRRAEKLKERMEARQLERGSSLAQMMKAPLDRTGSFEGDSQRNEDRSRPIGVRNELQHDGTSGGSNAEKDARTREYYAKLDKEDADRESARRATTFKSSLTSSLTASKEPTRTLQSSLMASIDATPVRTLKSSLAASLAPSRKIVSRIKKLQYSIADLRRLMAFAISKPTDLPSMKIVEVIQVRDPSSVSKRSSGRFGGGGRSIGGSLRKGDRSGRGPPSRQQSGSGNGQRDRQGRGGRGGGRGGRGGGGGRGYRPPPPPLYDGPIEPLTVSENRWKPNKEKKTSQLENTLSNVKSLLNKLTREKFAKLTSELCAIEIDSLILLSSIVSIIMNKALEEPNFADVYADLCKEFHKRTIKKTWSFLHILDDGKGAFYWAAIDKTAYTSFAGPFDSVKTCLEDSAISESAAKSTSAYASMSYVKFCRHKDYLIAFGEKEKGSFYYMKRKISELPELEPVEGPFETVEQARHTASSLVTFTHILVRLCQNEFEKTNKHSGPLQEKKEEEEVDPRKREILVMRAKAKMLGNIRFIGELFKVDMIKQSVVQGCLLYLLGLKLIDGEAGKEAHAEAVRFPDEEDLEALCKMLATAGKKFDQPKTKTIMNIIILRMVELSDDQKLPSRARFLVKDILETRDHMWEPRRKEMQQKTLEEVRREAQKLQQQGKNAQHDDLKRRRHKTQISSAQLAKQSSNLIVARKEEPQQDELSANDLSPAQMSTRIKSIIQEYLSILDLDEATTCVQELPVDPYHIEFAEQAINTALEGKTSEREHAVELLVGLYERGALDANSIQTALVNVMEFLEDLRIDLPLVHQYSALIFGRLVAAGCFGLSWIISDALTELVECKLTSLVFPEVLSVLELESDERTVIRMLTDEEITPGSVLPAAIRDDDAEVEAYLRENGIEEFFGGGSDEEDELDPEIAGKMRSTLDEYLSIKDVNEVVQCIDELEDVPDRWHHFVHLMLLFSLEARQSVRIDVADLLLQLFNGQHITSEDIEIGIDSILGDYDDLRVDIPQIAVNLSELWTPLFEKQALAVSWLIEACSHLVESGRAADVLDALLSAFKAQNGEEALVTWWKQQSNIDAVWTQMSAADEDGKPLDERLANWKSLLQ
ncbi:hypothetical protein PHYBOEH_009907 [Phytophthora boehmeriae]|uniref:MI domain-containing protein n=1 Tax=Phytophthora boehmeriae TaxID=109152 RepID=A0A8T1WZZ0_9STRA|nr:hypothetical protein PHYBOEH_009907 [Phytophthora boehmeriae]